MFSRTCSSLIDLWPRLSEDSGQTLVEYGLIFTLVVVVVIGALALLGGPLEAMYSGLGNAL